MDACANGSVATSSARRIGPALAFERLWEETGCREVIENLARARHHDFALERAVFLTVLHRLFAGGSDRAAGRWRQDYRIEGVEGLDLHHLYRAMAWLGEELSEDQQDGATPFAPRCLKDVVEETLFARRRDLFSTLDLVFMDTTSLYFEGAGGQTLGRRGFSKDHRPDLNQMILAVLLDGDGRPVCTEMWPGNTADTGSLIPVVDRLRKRFSVRRVCVIADRGMISAETIAELEARGLLYILGVRERTDKLVRDLVLDDPAPFIPFVLTKRKKDIEYEAKAVTLAGRRYIVCRNCEEMKKDAAARAAILTALERQLKKGDKSLVGNKGYRRFLATPGDDRFAIDRAKAEEDAKFDGVFVLRTNADLSPLEAIDQPRRGGLWIIGRNEIEVCLIVRFRQLGGLTGVDPMGVLHDLAFGGLPEHFGQSDDRDSAAGDDVGEHLAGTKGRQLINVANEQHGGSIVDRLHQGVHQDDVDHGRLVDDEKIAGERIVFVASKAAGLRIGFQQAVDGLGFVAGRFRHSLGLWRSWGVEGASRTRRTGVR